MNATTIFASTEPTSDGSNLSTGDIIGIVFGLFTAFGTIIAVVPFVICCCRVHIPNNILHKRHVDRRETLILEAWTLGKLEYKWNNDSQYYAKKSYTIPDTPSQTEVEYSCKITPRNCFRKWRSREVKFICRPNVPSAPPSDVLVITKDSRSVSLSWNAPPAADHNGQLTGYTIKVKDQNGNEARRPLTTDNTCTSKEVDGLKPNTDYIFQVSAMTAAGTGTPTSKKGHTAEGVPSAPPNDLHVTDHNSRSVHLSWAPPPAEQHNGQLIGYTIEVKYQNWSESRCSLTTGNTCTTTNVDSLKPNTDYIFEVSAMTATGSGASTSTTHRTTEEAPSAAPHDFTIELTLQDHSRSAHLSWISPPAEDCNGDIIGYEVVEEGPYSTQTHLVKTCTSLEIPNLTFMGYKFKVCAMTSAGRGPFSEEIVELDYYSIFAERYEKLAKERTDKVLKDIEFVHPVLVQPTQHIERQKYTTPGMDIDKIPGEKVDFIYNDLLKQESGSRILLQGRPGCGKSRLMKQISRELANKNRNGPDRKFVVFVKLRELSERKFEEKDRLKYLLCTAGVDFFDDAAKENLLSSKFDRQSKGSNIIFIFDGFDECDPNHESTDLIRDIFMNKMTAFENSIVIMSSRPSATCDFQEADRIKIIEIFGFKRKEVFQYLQNANKEKLNEYLEDNPKIMNMCYLPLYCAMLVQLSDNMTDLAELPQTESEFYKHFTLSTYNRYVRKKEVRKGVEIEQLSVFESLGKQRNFKEICEVAYNGTKDSKQVFTGDDISKREVFDLLVAEQVIVPLGGAQIQSYSFVHLTFQEYLTAIYIAWYHDKSQQNALVTKHCSERAFLVVWQFFFGILKPYSDKLFSKIQDATPDDQLLHVRCAYESQDPTACAKVLDFHNSLECHSIHPSDLPCLTYVLESTPAVEYKLKFWHSNFSVEDAHTFLKGIGHHQLSLAIQYGDAAQSVLDALCDVTVTGLKELMIVGFPIKASGSILKNCSNLKSLELVNVDMSNFGLEEELDHWSTSLETLSLSYPMGSGTRAQSEGIRNCKELKTLDFSCNPIGSGIKALSEGIRNCRELKTLSLRECGLGIEEAEMLGDFLSQASWIQSIDLSGNPIGSGVKALSEGIRNCKELKTLCLQDCQFGVEEAEILGDFLSYASRIQSINLSSNPIGSGVKALSEGIRNCKELKTLDLLDCQFGVEEAEMLGNFLSQASWIQSIDLSYNPIGSGIKALSEGIRNCKELKTLRLQCCEFGVKEAEMLGDFLSQASCIQSIDLSENPLGDGGPALLEGIRKCEQLKQLRLAKCGFGVKEAEMLGDILSNASWIQFIDLSGNPLSDGGPALLEGIRKCEQLKGLWLSTCDLYDDAGITKLIESIKTLENLLAQRNKFTHDQKERLEKAVTERNSKEGMTKLELFI